MKREDIVYVLLVVLIAVGLRVVPHAPNFSPVFAMAIFAGAYLPKKFALALPICVMVLSDVILGFHESVIYVYSCILFSSFLGVWVKDRKSIGMVFGVSLFSAVLFFLVTNFGYFLNTSLYPKTFEGQMSAYINALPFFRNTVLSNIFYSGIFFGGYVVFLRIMKGVISADLHKNRG